MRVAWVVVLAAGCGRVDFVEDCELRATVRDFTTAHPDFQVYNGSTATTGLVYPVLDVEGKPLFDGTPGVMITSSDSFHQWYRDVPGTNLRFQRPLTLAQTDVGTFVFDSDMFFPIDDAGFEERIDEHNFLFTTEIHTRMVYRGGERLAFRGDDDVWVFVNRRLALDLGGLHTAVAGEIDFDTIVASHALAAGSGAAIDVFHAERRSGMSNFRLELTGACQAGL